MALSFNNRPFVLAPIYNPFVFNLTTTNYQDVDFKWSMLVQNGYSLTSQGTFYKQPTDQSHQWFEPSRILQSNLTFTFPSTGQTSKPFADGINNIESVTNTFGAGTASTVSYANWYFNGSIDRNVFNSLNDYDFIPTLSASTRARLLTDYQERTVGLLDEGTMSMVNGKFVSTLSSITANNTYIEITATTNNSTSKYHLYNSYYSDVLTTATNKRVTFGAYPKNLNDGCALHFYDNSYYNFTPSYSLAFVFTSPHGLIVGDTVQVIQDAGYTNSSYNGLATIVSIPNETTIVLDKPFLSPTPAEGGTIFKTNTVSVFSEDLTSYVVTGVTSGAGSKAQFFFDSSFDVSKVVLNTLCYNFNFSDVNYNLPVYFTSGITSNSLLSNIGYSSNVSGNTIVRSRPVIGPIISDVNTMYTLQMGSKPNYNLATKTGITSSAITITNFGKVYTFNVDDCCNQNEDLMVAWQNKWGAFDYINFNYKKTKIVKFNRNNMTKRLGGGTGVYSYNTTDSETQSFNGSQFASYEYNTDWLTDIGSQRIIELCGSLVVFAKIDGVWTPIIPTMTDQVVKTIQNDKLISYTITFEATYNTLSQRR